MILTPKNLKDILSNTEKYEIDNNAIQKTLDFIEDIDFRFASDACKIEILHHLLNSMYYTTLKYKDE